MVFSEIKSPYSRLLEMEIGRFLAALAACVKGRKQSSRCAVVVKDPRPAAFQVYAKCLATVAL